MSPTQALPLCGLRPGAGLMLSRKRPRGSASRCFTTSVPGIPLLRPKETQGGVVLVMMEVGHGKRPQRGAGGQFGALEIDRVIIPAQGELPAGAHGWGTAGALKVFPGNAALDRPTAVPVFPVVERAA